MNHTTNTTTPIQTTVANPCSTVSIGAHPAYTGPTMQSGGGGGYGYAAGYASGPGYTAQLAARGEIGAIVRQDGTGTVIIDELKLGADAELLIKRLERIEAALGIATRLPTLESTYTELHEAGENMDHVITHARHINEVIGAGSAYIALTNECEIMEKLKSNNDPE
jgi:hypothetical protein